MQKLGLTMTIALLSAFACELAMKAIRLTRTGEARSQHDFEHSLDLPEDCRMRMETDDHGIEAVLDKARHSFHNWRKFENSIEGGGISTMADTELVMVSGKTARVFIDEAAGAGLRGKVSLDATQVARERGRITKYNDFKTGLREHRLCLRRLVDSRNAQQRQADRKLAPAAVSNPAEKGKLQEYICPIPDRLDLLHDRTNMACHCGRNPHQRWG